MIESGFYVVVASCRHVHPPLARIIHAGWLAQLLGGSAQSVRMPDHNVLPSDSPVASADPPEARIARPTLRNLMNHPGSADRVSQLTVSAVPICSILRFMPPMMILAALVAHWRCHTYVPEPAPDATNVKESHHAFRIDRTRSGIHAGCDRLRPSQPSEKRL